jgi:hypothetical protein
VVTVALVVTDAVVAVAEQDSPEPLWVWVDQAARVFALLLAGKG